MCERILNELDAGATLIDANGAYTKLSKKALAEKELEKLIKRLKLKDL